MFRRPTSFYPEFTVNALSIAAGLSLVALMSENTSGTVKTLSIGTGLLSIALLMGIIAAETGKLLRTLRADLNEENNLERPNALRV